MQSRLSVIVTRTHNENKRGCYAKVMKLMIVCIVIQHDKK